MRLPLPEKVEYIISRLEDAGFSAHVVGGSVRDLLLLKSPGDYDITTSALPEETKAVFFDHRTVDTGIKHGTVSLILDSSAYEITTYRLDGEYSDARHPESVSFTRSITEDLRRRDFTVNAIAYNHKDGVIDPFGGREDLAGRVIRAVGDADKRFSEDALRILRALRFSASLGFTIEPETASALLDRRDLLAKVSAERIYTELKKTLSADRAYSVVSAYPEIFSPLLGLDRIILPSEEAFCAADYPTRLISIFYLSSPDPKSAFSSAARALRTDSNIRETGECLLSSLTSLSFLSERDVLRSLRAIGVDRARAMLALRKILGIAADGEERLFNKVVSSSPVYRVSDLAIGGSELLSIGASGREVGLILEGLLSSVIEGGAENDPRELLSLSESMLSEMREKAKI